MKPMTLAALGWSDHFASQIQAETPLLTPPARISDVHRARVEAKTIDGDVELDLPMDIRSGDLAVGDWVLSDPVESRVVATLDRRNVLRRRTVASGHRHQLIAANVDALFIVSSCNADFNPARLERYLALAISSEIAPVLVLTKADMTDDTDDYLRRAEALLPDMKVVVLNARDPVSLAQLSPWIGVGMTAALIGSSGVGKSTIMNGLTGEETATQGIRENDAKGRHTTTARSLRLTHAGGWLIDTPGMRSLTMSENAEGIDVIFADLIELAATCKFSDCKHQTEPGCAIRAAIKKGELEESRFLRWLKLQDENHGNTESPDEAKTRSKSQRPSKSPPTTRRR
tara:strand:+ start:40548 stop:41576 length:1029 start_codon:yes stop_codon:yes gene_type:complete